MVLITLFIFLITGIIIYWGFSDNPEMRQFRLVAFVPIFNYMMGFFALLYVLEKVFTKGCKISHKSQNGQDKYICKKCSKIL